MAQISIIDIGKANLQDSGQTETQANGGTAFTFRAVDINYDRGTGTDDSAVPAEYADSIVNFSATNNPRIVLRGILDWKQSADVDSSVEVLDDLCTTKGIKALYYSSTADGFQTITTALGNTTNGSLTADDLGIGSDTKWIPVRCTSLGVSQDGKNDLVRYTLTLVRTSG